MIISRSALILIIACAAVSIGVVALSQRTLALQRELSQINDQIEDEKQLIAVLESEWALFTSPTSLYAKLEAVRRNEGQNATAGMDLQPLNAAHVIASVEAIPMAKPRWAKDESGGLQMVQIEGTDESWPLPPHKPASVLRPIAEARLVAIHAPKAQPAAPAATPAPAPVQDDDAIGDLLRDLKLAIGAVAEVTDQ